MSERRDASPVPAELALVADAVPHRMAMLSPRGKVLHLNRSARTFFGLDPQAHRSPSPDLGDLIHPGDVTATVRGWIAAGHRGGAYESEIRLRRADGAFRRHHVRVAPIADRAGGVVRWVATGTDLESQPGRSVVMDDMVEGFYTLDPDGVLTSLNRAGTVMLGWQEHELLGAVVHTVIHAPGSDRSECPLLWRDGQDRPAQMIDDTFVRKDGSTFPVTCSVAPWETRDAGPGTVVTFRDMTQVRRAELEARHDQKLESLGRLSAGLAHEINTPIQFVGDNTRFLASAYEDMLELLLVYRGCMAPGLGEIEWADRVKRAQQAEQKADVEYLAVEIPAAVSQSLDGIERVASLVRAMKSFSYKDPTEQSYADLNEAVRTTLTVARNEVKYVADVTLDLGEIPLVLCHRGDLNQVFLNLLVNAADALQDKGERGEIRISSAVAGRGVEIRFADNGGGIPDHVRRFIFDPFFTTKGVGKGTGQGLALARAVLDKHGGSIDVRSVAGEGTEFVLRLPIDGRQETAG